ncbi:MAG: TonB-dependent receptor [Bacteroidales bacterium]|nr:MAG: TonB-dependent receptor [Bacteroidales bacterium]
MRQACFIFLFLFSFSQAFSQFKKTYSINGYVEDIESGEKLIGCFVLDSMGKHGTVTNAFGYFNLTQSAGKCFLTTRYLGYVNQSIQFNVNKDTTIIIKLLTHSIKIDEVVVVRSIPEDKLSRPQIGLLNISSKDVKKLPVLLGEADVMRALQNMPGIQAANERSSGISVRGGSIDQNLFLLDDAPVFQITHVGGFYSVFNNEAIKDIKVYKGDIPANYGGRLSSVIDIRQRDGNMQNYAISGGIGIVAANLSIEGPIMKDRISFIVSGKSSYIGLLYKLMHSNMVLSFYDLNCKLNAIINTKNRIFISSYSGGDKFDKDLNSNKTFSVRWNHVYNPKLFSNASLIYSSYCFKSGNSDNTNNNSYAWRSGLNQLTLKAEYNYYLNSNNIIDFGVSSSYNTFIPGKLEGNKNTIENITQSIPFSYRMVDEQKVIDYAIYVSNQQKLTERLSFRYGVRASLYQNIGNGQWVYRLNDYQVADSFYVSQNSSYSNFFNIEPRLSLNYRIAQNSAIKASYTYTTQQTQLLMKTNGGGPLDVWFPSGVNIKPQLSSQYSLGFIQYLFNNSLEASLEGYYKDMNNIIDYKDGATFMSKNSISEINKTSYNFEEQLRTGRGYAYGLEIMLKGGNNKIDGFIGYTYARSKRVIQGINFGNTYLSPFDKPHTLDISLNFNVTKRVSLSSNFRYQSGQVITVPIYVMEMWGKTLAGYSNRNEYRLPAYQRIDLSLVIKNKQKLGKRYHSEWNFSVVNILNHANIAYIDFVPSKENPNIIDAKGTSMLGIVPSVSYQFNF